jgi:hypothetical protein
MHLAVRKPVKPIQHYPGSFLVSYRLNHHRIWKRSGQGAITESALMMVLNGLQPTGVTTIALDRNNLAASLGATAAVTPLLTIQSLDASNFVNLCTIISPVGNAPMGTPILRVRMSGDDGFESEQEVKNGTMTVFKLPQGQAGTLHLTPLHKFDVGMGGYGRGGTVKVIGGVFGVVIDARGRPLRMPAEPSRRREALNKWLTVIGSG